MLSSRPVTLIGLCCAALVAGCDRQSQAPAQPDAGARATGAAAMLTGAVDRSHKGQPLPSYSVSQPDGRKLDLASLKGQPVLVNLWATWCAPCVAELPTLDRLAAAKPAGLRVLTVSQDMQPDKVAAFLRAKGGAHLEPWLDPETELSFKYATPTLPTTILYDAAGKEVWRFVGGHDWSDPDARALLGEADAG